MVLSRPLLASRSDLTWLEERGLVHRTHGSDTLAGQMLYEPFRFDSFGFKTKWRAGAGGLMTSPFRRTRRWRASRLTCCPAGVYADGGRSGICPGGGSGALLLVRCDGQPASSRVREF